MRITILTAGSRGDIQPYLGLAVGLRRAGHRVKLATHINYQDWIESHGIEYAEMSANPREMTDKREVNKWVDSGRNIPQYLKTFKQVLLPILTQMIYDTWEASKGSDLLIPGPLCYYPAYVASREQHIPWIQTFLQPFHPTAAYPSALIPTQRSYGRFGNLMSHYIGGTFLWAIMRPAFNEVLKDDFHLEPLPHDAVLPQAEKAGIPSLYAYSPAFLPKPRDWSQHLHITGNWFLKESDRWTPPPQLMDFLDAGPAPIYIGFGSMPLNDPEKTTQVIFDAVRKTGQRAVVLTGWGGLGHSNVPDNVLMIENAPHDWLFPRMAAIIHHGGAGTTAASLRAGKPCVVVPFFADQPWWAMRSYERGLSPKPIDFQKLTADNLADAINLAVSDPQIRQRAAWMGEQIRSEDGVGCAVRIIHEYMKLQ